jgi:putative FmdB family regulatory protein
MPLYDYQCANGHRFERMVPLAQFDFAQLCECGAGAKQIFPKFPGMNLSSAEVERAAYMEHNITFTGGSKEVQHKPNEHAQQCQCDGCRGHRRRANVTGTAEPLRTNKRVAKEVRA